MTFRPFAILASLLSALVALFAGLGQAALAAPSPGSATAATKNFLRASAAAEANGYVKRSGSTIEIQGWVSETHLDGGPRHPERTQHYLEIHASGGKTFRLSVPRSADITSTVPGQSKAQATTLSDGAVAKVTGTVSGGTVKVASATTTAVVSPPSFGPVDTARTLQTRRILIIPVRFADDTQTTPVVDADVIKTEMFGDASHPYSIANYYAQSSRQTLSITGDVTPWQTIPRSDYVNADGTPGHCNYPQWQTDAENQVRSTYDPSTYDIVNLVVSPDGGCPWAGATWDARHDVSVVHGDSDFWTRYDIQTQAHELGHVFSLGHSGALMCKSHGARVPVSATCAPTSADGGAPDYTDRNDVMGYDGNRLLTGYHRARLGFIPGNNIADITADGLTHTITGNQQPLGTSKQLLRIARPGAPSDRKPDDQSYYYLEYRQASAPFDVFGAGDATPGGITIGIANDYHQSSEEAWAVNASPGWSNYGNANALKPDHAYFEPADPNFALMPGQSLWDPVENYTITDTGISSDGNSANVRVTPGPPTGNATTVAVSGTTLNVTGGAGKRNVVSVVEDDGALVIADQGNPVTPGAGCVALDPVTVSCTKNALRTITIDTGDLDDVTTIWPNVTVPVTYVDGLGNDAFQSLADNSIFQAGSAPNGDDVMAFAGAKSGVSYATRSQPVTIHDSGADNGQAGEHDMILGTPSLDTPFDSVPIVPASVIRGGSGADTILATSSVNHTIDGGTGLDAITAGDGDDTIAARDSVVESTLVCGGGDDTIDRDSGDTNDSSCEHSNGLPQAQISGGVPDGVTVATIPPAYTLSTPYQAGASFNCKLQGPTGTATFATCTSPYTVPSSIADGTYTLSVQAKFGTALTGTVVSRTFTLNRVVPNTTFTSIAPDGAAAEFSYSATASGVGFECSLDGANYVSCLSTKKLTGLTDGSHTFKVRAYNSAGTVDATPATVTWTVDLTPPHTTITTTPATGSFEQGSAKFTLTANETATFKCAWDGGTATACTSPVTAPDSQQTIGNHTLAVTATDTSGNVETPPTTRAFTVIAQSFTTTITSAPPKTSWTNNEHPVIAFTSTPATGYTFQCSVNSGAWSACTSPWTSSTLDDGYLNVIDVRAVSSGGVVDFTPATTSVLVDTTAPNTKIETGPADLSTLRTFTGSTTATFTFSTPGETPPTNCTPGTYQKCVTFQCKLDAGAWAACPSPYTTPALTPGSHTLNVRAIDAASNVDATPEVRTLTVVAADTSITSGPADGKFTNGTVPFAFASTPASGFTFECATTGNAFAPCTSPYTLPTVTNGTSTTFQVRAKDTATGAVDPTPATRTLSFDTVAPDTQIDAGPNGTTINVPSTSYSFSAPGEATAPGCSSANPSTCVTFQCQLDSATYATCASPLSLTGLTAGSHTFRVRTVDAAGNVDGSPAVRTFTAAPILTVDTGAYLQPVEMTTDATLGASLDWIHWRGAAATSFDRKNATQQISTWSPLGGSGLASVTSIISYHWTDATGSTPAATATQGVLNGGAVGRGFRVTVPATNAATRTIRLDAGGRGVGTVAQLSVSLNGQTPVTATFSPTSDTNLSMRPYVITYRPLSATDTLTIDLTQTNNAADTAAGVALFAAALH